jgi:hypothetical protein
MARVFHVKHWQECEKLGVTFDLFHVKHFNRKVLMTKRLFNVQTSKWDEK